MTKTKKIIQFSKLITVILLLMNFITWARAMCLYWYSPSEFNYMLDATRSLAEAVLPYFCLSAADRLVYISENIKEYLNAPEKPKRTRKAKQ